MNKDKFGLDTIFESLGKAQTADIILGIARPDEDKVIKKDICASSTVISTVSSSPINSMDIISSSKMSIIDSLTIFCFFIFYKIYTFFYYLFFVVFII